MKLTEYNFINESSQSVLSLHNVIELTDYHQSHQSDRTMSSIGAHAAFKVRNNFNSTKVDLSGRQYSVKSSTNPTTNSTEQGTLTPPNYSEKMMNSIWGLYNKYSVHNIKSHNPLSGSQN